MRFVAWYSLAVGILMLVQWGFFLATGQVPELSDEPFRIGLHLLGEGVTSVALILSGAALLKQRPWASNAAFGALGMLTYTVIVSPGYFAQLGQWLIVVMFGILLLLTLASFYLLAGERRSPTLH